MNSIFYRGIVRQGLMRRIVNKPLLLTTQKRWNSNEVVKGLAGVNVAESSVCTVGVTGIGLNYRGFGIDGMIIISFTHCNNANNVM